MHAALGGVRPDEAAAFQALGQQAQSIAVPPEQIDQVAPSATEDKDLPTKWVGRQVRLNNGRQASLRSCVQIGCEDPQKLSTVLAETYNWLVCLTDPPLGSEVTERPRPPVCGGMG